MPSVSQAEMQHYKTVQQRFSAETMNSEDKMQAKEAKEAATEVTPQMDSRPPQQTPLNGYSLTNGHGHGEDPVEEEVPVVQDRKGKGKARQVVDDLLHHNQKKDKGKGKAKAQ